MSGRVKRFEMTRKETNWWQNHWNKGDIVEIEHWKLLYESLYNKKRDILKKYVKK